MLKSIFNDTDIQLPEQIHKAAVEYLPAFLSAEDAEALAAQAQRIARAFDAEGSFEQVFTGAEPVTRDAQIHLIRSFEKNVRLLVDKMWVEKTDEYVKEDVLYRLGCFCESMQEKNPVDYVGLLPECIGVLHDVVLLLFGRQIDSGEFLEYAIRIDPDFGLFWYYLECLTAQPKLSAEKARLAIFIGIYFLANF
jgi:hypothetical protein|nr:hypothetical protein [uncultured Treponema sp.]